MIKMSSAAHNIPKSINSVGKPGGGSSSNSTACRENNMKALQQFLDKKLWDSRLQEKTRLKSKVRFPVSLKTFKTYTHYNEVVDELLANYCGGDNMELRRLQQNAEVLECVTKNLFEAYYLCEDVRKHHMIKLKACPEHVKNQIKSKYTYRPDIHANIPEFMVSIPCRKDGEIQLLTTDDVLEPCNRELSRNRRSAEIRSSTDRPGTSAVCKEMCTLKQFLDKKLWSNKQQQIEHGKFPVSFIEFKSYTHYDIIVDHFLKRFCNGDDSKLQRLKESAEVREFILRKYYEAYYRCDRIRNKYRIKFKECPSHLRNRIRSTCQSVHIEEEIRNAEMETRKNKCVESSGNHTTCDKNSNPSHMNAEQHGQMKNPENIKNLSEICKETESCLPQYNLDVNAIQEFLDKKLWNNARPDVNPNKKFPATYNEFKMYTRYEWIVNHLLKRFCDGDETKYRRLEKSEAIHECVLRNYYEAYYLCDKIRNVYRIECKPCPAYMKDKIRSTYNSSDIDEDIENREMEANKKGCDYSGKDITCDKKSNPPHIYAEQHRQITKIQNLDNLAGFCEEPANQLEVNAMQEFLNKKLWNNARPDVDANRHFPATYNEFKKYTHNERIVHHLLKRFCDSDEVKLKRLEKCEQVRECILRNYYEAYYLYDRIRNIYRLEFKACPAHIKNKIRSTYNSSDNEQETENREMETSKTKNDENCGKYTTCDKNTNPPQMDAEQHEEITNSEHFAEFCETSTTHLPNYNLEVSAMQEFLDKKLWNNARPKDNTNKIFPVTYDEFKMYTRYEGIVNHLLKRFCDGDEIKFKRLEKCEPVRECILRNYYEAYYLCDRIRFVYKIECKPCPAYMKDKIRSTYNLHDNEEAYVNAQYCPENVKLVVKTEENKSPLSCGSSTSTSDKLPKGVVVQKTIENYFASLKQFTEKSDQIKNCDVNSLQHYLDKKLWHNKQISEFDAVKLPVSIEIFNEFSNCDKIVNHLIQCYCKAYKIKPKDMLKNEKLRECALYNYYKAFYLQPAIRSKLPLPLKKCSSVLRDKILSHCDVADDDSDATIDSDDIHAKSQSLRKRSRSCHNVTTNTEPQCKKNKIITNTENDSKATKEDQQCTMIKEEGQYHSNNATFLQSENKVDESKLPIKFQEFLEHSNILDIVKNLEEAPNNNTNKNSEHSNDDYLLNSAYKLYIKFLTEPNGRSDGVFKDLMLRYVLMEKLTSDLLNENPNELVTSEENTVSQLPTTLVQAAAAAPQNNTLNDINMANIAEQQAHVDSNEQNSGDEKSDAKNGMEVENEIKTETRLLVHEQYIINDDFLKRFLKIHVSDCDKHDEIMRQIKLKTSASVSDTRPKILSVQVIQESTQHQHVDMKEVDELFFANVEKCYTLPYLMRTTRGYKQRLVDAMMNMSIAEFQIFTHIHNVTNPYKDVGRLKRYYRHVMAEKRVWPINLYTRIVDLLEYLQLKEITLDSFHMKHISPKFLHWQELARISDFDECVRLDYYKFTAKQLPSDDELLLNERRKDFYRRCWKHEKWIWREPVITDVELKAKIQRLKEQCAENDTENEQLVDNDNISEASHVIYRHSDEYLFYETATSPTDYVNTQQSSTDPQIVVIEPDIDMNTEEDSSCVADMEADTDTQVFAEVNTTNENQSIYNELEMKLQQMFAKDSNITEENCAGYIREVLADIAIDINYEQVKNSLSKVISTRPQNSDAAAAAVAKDIVLAPSPNLFTTQSDSALEVSRETYCSQAVKANESNFITMPNTQQQIDSLPDEENVKCDPLSATQSPNSQSLIPITSIKQEKDVVLLKDLQFSLDSNEEDFHCVPISDEIVEIVDEDGCFGNGNESQNNLLLQFMNPTEENQQQNQSQMDENAICDNTQELSGVRDPASCGIADEEGLLWKRHILENSMTLERVVATTAVTTVADVSSVATSVQTTIADTERDVATTAVTTVADVSSVATSVQTTIADTRTTPTPFLPKKVRLRRKPKPKKSDDTVKQQLAAHNLQDFAPQLTHQFRALPFKVVGKDGKLMTVQCQVNNETNTQFISAAIANNNIINTTTTNITATSLSASVALTTDCTLFNNTQLLRFVDQQQVIQFYPYQDANIQSIMPTIGTTNSTATSLSASQALTTDCTLFDNSQILRVVDEQQQQQQQQQQRVINVSQHLASLSTDTGAMATTSTTSNQVNPHDRILAKTLLYRDLLQFHYFEELTQQHIIDYQLRCIGVGNRYMQALIATCDGRKTKLYGDTLNAILSHCTHTILSDVRYVLRDLGEFHYNVFAFVKKKKKKQTTTTTKGNIATDLRERVLNYFLRSSSVFCYSYLHYDCLTREYGYCESITSLTNETLTRRPQWSTLSAALKSKILNRMANVKLELQNDVV